MIMAQMDLTLAHPGDHGLNDKELTRELHKAVKAVESLPEDYIVTGIVNESGVATVVTVEFEGEATPPEPEPTPPAEREVAGPSEASTAKKRP